MKPGHADDATIAAIATPPGAGGIGIIRISGQAALPVLKKLFVAKSAKSGLESRKLTYGWIVSPFDSTPVDEVLAVFMPAPHTYTREDIVEIHCHGNYFVLEQILSLVLAADSDVRLADPGEFTKRAFLNGRIDLTQAEAVIDLLNARTREGVQLATAQLQGGLHDQVMAVRAALLGVLAIIEVAIDFPDEDVEILDSRHFAEKLKRDALIPLNELIASAEKGKIFREGISVVIVGRPNVGKSSLLNSLLREERAIVTAVPGTTRDTIEELIDIKGIPVRVVDTAGIRETSEAVEEIGIRRAREKVAGADLVLFMCDASQDIAPEEQTLFESIKEKQPVLVVNKIDLAPKCDLREYQTTFPGIPVAAVSAKTQQGIAGLEDLLFEVVTGDDGGWDPGHAGVPNLRHRASLVKGAEAVARVTSGLEEDRSPDLLAIDLQAALDHLADIVGETTTEDVLDMIFEQFCIGK